MVHILLIDDDEDEHLFFKWSIEKIQPVVTLTCVFSGLQALELFSKKIPDFIFLDINLPGADGFECLNDIRNLHNLKDVPVFMYSTEISETSLQKAIMLGATGCIKKSRSHEVLFGTIRQKLNLSEKEIHSNVLMK